MALSEQVKEHKLQKDNDDSYTSKSVNLSVNFDLSVLNGSLLFSRTHGFTDLRQFKKGK